MCFFGFLRSGEVVVPDGALFDAETHLVVGDPTNPEFLEVRLKASKTDTFRLGVSIYLGKAHSDLCPVTAVLAYVVQRSQTSGPFFNYTGGHPLTRARFVEAVWILDVFAYVCVILCMCVCLGCLTIDTMV